MYMSSSQKKESEKPMSERWKDYGTAMFKFIVNWIIWLLVGAMSLWALRNRSRESSLPIDVNNLPYDNKKGVKTKSTGGLSDVPLFTYNPPVAFPYNMKSDDCPSWGFGDWFSRTEAGSWSISRRVLHELGTLVIGFYNSMNTIPDVPGMKLNYTSLAELLGMYILPIFVLFGLTIAQPIITTIATLIGSFHNNSVLWGIIGIFTPTWILNFFNVFLQHVYLGIFLLWLPAFSGGLGFMKRVILDNKMLMLSTLCLVAIALSTQYLPGEVTGGMLIGFLVLMVWHYFFGPTTSAALSGLAKAGKGLYKKAPTMNRNNNNSSSSNNSSNNSNSSNNRNNSNSNNRNRNTSNRKNSNKRAISFSNVTPSEVSNALNKAYSRK